MLNQTSVIGALAYRRAARLGRLAERVEALTPWVMIAAGLYILADTATDVA